MSEVDTKDYIASDLIVELKAENERKDSQIRGLHRLLAASLQCSTDGEAQDGAVLSGSGVYAVVDSDGNIIGQDLTPTEVQQLMEVVADDTSEATSS